MSKHPKTIEQLNRKLKPFYTEAFPYGKYKNRRPEDVVKIDPNYVAWWSETVIDFPLNPKIVREAIRNYQEILWFGGERYWNNDGDYDLEDWQDTAEAIEGNPWGFGRD